MSTRAKSCLVEFEWHPSFGEVDIRNTMQILVGYNQNRNEIYDLHPEAVLCQKHEISREKADGTRKVIVCTEHPNGMHVDLQAIATDFMDDLRHGDNGVWAEVYEIAVGLIQDSVETDYDVPATAVAY
jgi:hypothetical protein